MQTLIILPDKKNTFLDCQGIKIFRRAVQFSYYLGDFCGEKDEGVTEGSLPQTDVGIP